MLPGWIVVFGGMAGVITALLGKVDRLPRNHWAGIRTRTTTRDDDTWRAAHRAGWLYLALAGLMAVGIGAYMVANPDRPPPIWSILVVLIPTIVAGFVGHAAAKKVVESYDDR